jgi:hypothetical protein
MADINKAFDRLTPHSAYPQNSEPLHYWYSDICPSCGTNNTSAVTNDGGSICWCDKCNKMFKAKILKTELVK